MAGALFFFKPQMEMSQYQLVANFGARRKPEMTFILSISDAISTYGFNEKCSIEINGDEVQTCYNYFKPRTANKTGIPKNLKFDDLI